VDGPVLVHVAPLAHVPPEGASVDPLVNAASTVMVNVPAIQLPSGHLAVCSVCNGPVH
jgi:hypothetical protein